MRKRCHWRNFVQPASAELAQLPTPTPVAYVATDTVGVVGLLCDELRQRTPALVCASAPERLLDRCNGGAERRGPACLRFALAEAVLLSQAAALVYSDYSSFSELVRNLGAAHRLARNVSGCSAGKAAKRGGGAR